MTTREATCADRIKDEYLAQEAWIAELYTKSDEGDDQATEEIYEQAYGISRYTLIKIELSGGGPSSWLEAKYDAVDGLIRLTYYFADWFDVASHNVPEDNALWRYALEIIDGMDF